MIYDLIVIGSGAAGSMAAITSAREGKKVLLLEKLPKLSTKLKATGGGRCNLTNTLSNDVFMQKFGRNGKFMMQALSALNSADLVEFFSQLGVETHSPDGFRIFPTTHNAQTILDGLEKELRALHVDIECNQKVISIETNDEYITGLTTLTSSFNAKNIIIATGGLGYPKLGAEGDGHKLAKALHHKITELHPAMMPLITKESWVENCRADTIAKVEMKVDIKKYKNLKAFGDLIFTKTGIRGPVVLDFAREITPLLSKYDEVPILMNLTKGKDEDSLIKHLKSNSTLSLLENIKTLLPEALSREIILLAKADEGLSFSAQKGEVRNQLIKLLAWTPLTISSHEGFKMAMITRGGVSLKEIKAESMASKRIKGLYFCGEVMDLDGPCGGYNLQWSFSSGYLAGKLLG